MRRFFLCVEPECPTVSGDSSNLVKSSQNDASAGSQILDFEKYDQHFRQIFRKVAPRVAHQKAAQTSYYDPIGRAVMGIPQIFRLERAMVPGSRWGDGNSSQIWLQFHWVCDSKAQAARPPPPRGEGRGRAADFFFNFIFIIKYN